MPLQSVQLPQQRSRAHELYDWLRAAILAGELRPRERLVETTIAELASVSRTPVREALHRLEVDGLVRQGEEGLEVYAFSLDELADVGAVREVLEGMATSLAASLRSEMEIETLRRISDKAEHLLDANDEETIRARVRLNHSFHETIWRATRNSYLVDILRHSRNFIERLQDTTLRQRDRTEQALREHRAIIEALDDRDGIAAERIARQHFRNAMTMRLGRSEDVNDRHGARQ